MPWTGEDTKDVLKKVLGGVIAAAILAIVYTLAEEMEWYVSAALGAVLIVLIIVAVSWLGRPEKVRPEALTGDELSAERPVPKPVLSEEAAQEPARKEETLADAKVREAEEKAAKKAAKDEYKRRKKEAKAREKASKP